MGTVLHHRPPIKIGGNFRSRGKGPHTDVEVRVAYSLLQAETLAFMLDGVRLTHLCIMPRTDDYLIMLKGTRKGKKKIAFLDAPTFRDVVVLAATSLDSGHIPWRDDKPRRQATT